jgi:hypothetical protein
MINLGRGSKRTRLSKVLSNYQAKIKHKYARDMRVK